MVPGRVWAITGLWAALLIGASLLWPMTYGYDEPEHVDMAYAYAAHPFRFYAPGQLRLSDAMVRIETRQIGYPPNTDTGSVPIANRPERPSRAALGGEGSSDSNPPDQMVQHPPLYYWTEAVVLRIPGVSSLAWDVQIWLMRLLSVLYMLPIPVLCWLTTRRLTAAWLPADAATLAALVPLTVPNLIRDGSAVTNDSLLILSCSVLCYAMARVLTGDLSKRTAAVIAASLMVALLTKGFALALPPFVLVAYLIGSGRLRPHSSWRARLRPLRAPLAIAALGGMVGSVWWLRNVIVYGTVQVDGYGAAYERVLHGASAVRDGSLVHFAPDFLREFTDRIWGGIGLADQPSPGQLVIYGWLALALAGLVAALANRGGPSRPTQLTLLAVPLSGMLIAATGSYANYRHDLEVAGAQGRYLYHGVVAVVVLVAVGWARIVRGRARLWSIPAILVAGLLTNAIAWCLILRSWYQAPSSITLASVGADVAALLRWAPVPVPVTVTAVLVLPLLAGLGVLGVLLRSAVGAGLASRVLSSRPSAPSYKP
jgi:hypothetical protein